MAKRLIIDVPNLFFRSIAAQKGKYSGDADDNAGLALHSCLLSINKWFRKINPDQTIVVFEGKKNWRKSYTKENECRAQYKGNRVYDPAMAPLYQALIDFEKLAREHTSIVCLSAPELEGDDLIAGCAEKFSREGEEVIILSGDKDFIQLLKHKNVFLMNPETEKFRTHEDPEFFMFEKCFRGDSGDNVHSAYPRLRTTKIKKAWEDEYNRTLLLNEQWSYNDLDTGEEITVRVGDLFEENSILMDLSKQPDYIKEIITETINYGLDNHGKFSLFAFSKFLKQHDLQTISKQVNNFIPVFSRIPKQEVVSSKVLQF